MIISSSLDSPYRVIIIDRQFPKFSISISAQIPKQTQQNGCVDLDNRKARIHREMRNGGAQREHFNTLSLSLSELEVNGERVDGNRTLIHAASVNYKVSKH